MKYLPILLIAAAMLFAVAPSTAGVSPGALRLLIVYSDGGHTEANLKSQLAAQPGVATVDTFNAGIATPGVDTLSAYDAVVSFSNTDYTNPKVLGDNMASYADQGGVVVEFAFNWFNRAQRQLGGRWATGGYSAYDGPAATVIQNGATFGRHEASSPLLAGVNALGTETHQDVGVAPRAVGVAKWSDGQSAIAFKGRAVGVNACVADGCNEFSGDFAKLIVNASATRVVGQLPLPDSACRPDTYLQTGVADGNSYAVPTPGVITSWYVQDGVPLTSDVQLRVARKSGADAVTFLGGSPAGARVAGGLDGPFPARISVSGGDVIGLTTVGDGRSCRFTNALGDTLVVPATDPSPGGPTPVVTGGSRFRFPIEAIVEPDGDNDGFGDLTQDRCPDVAGSVDGCRSADLSVSVTASAASSAPGGEVTYTVTATNNGPDPSPDAVLTNTLPGGAPTTSSLGTLASGQTASKTFVATPPVPGPATDSATVAGADDPNSANNSASATVSVIAPPPVLSHLTQTRRKVARVNRYHVQVRPRQAGAGGAALHKARQGAWHAHDSGARGHQHGAVPRPGDEDAEA
jgi:uncharacterized repeat protein (TIGR01451 family)